ncbi:nuclear receptor-binding factor 2-like [Littorina saxatilis]|uniref:Nuclear receptor-binding factor 2 MIT domain-containing protein n=1 Tax=Littorina saxatilis TaxID=31220 RepID=A0AAN9GK22_9CAEN
MDSSLNRAHQWSRKADDLTAAGKFEEAIACHNRASEHMLETLQAPVLYDNPSLISCLRLQHEHHLRQVKVLQVKQLRQAGVEARKSRPVKMRSKSIQTDAQNNLPHRSTGVWHNNVMVNTQDIEESIRDADTMLRYLKLRKDDPEAPLPWEENLLEKEKADNKEVAMEGRKKPKEDKEIVEELRCLTEGLREHIVMLVKESEWLKIENQGLHNHMSDVRKAEHDDGSSHEVDELIPLTTHFSNSSSFNLPPLEMPEIQLPPKLSSDSEEDLSDRI